MAVSDKTESLEDLYYKEAKEIGLTIIRDKAIWEHNINNYEEIMKLEKNERKQLYFVQGLIRFDDFYIHMEFEKFGEE
ncbi:6805_t:CDS:2 [Racocetra fulgida]|uniref:6805_t:CDS:1 n=1 Tax=Racocetra fulgida TaxID=60492 RepID=A0A9N9F1B9_9GLOM|nr:6805_t:CDS:2 [Racocetra fulgida]